MFDVIDTKLLEISYSLFALSIYVHRCSVPFRSVVSLDHAISVNMLTMTGMAWSIKNIGRIESTKIEDKTKITDSLP